jgi:hypothetical protein
MKHRVTGSILALAGTLALLAATARPACAQAPPKVPAFVQVLPSNGAVLVSWGNVANAVGYNIYRRTGEVTRDKAALLNAQPYGPTWLIDQVPNGTAVFYSVKALFQEGDKFVEGPASREAVGTPHAPLLGGLVAYDIGTEFPSSWTIEGDVLTVKASGHELWDQDDGGTFIGLPVSGDYTITVRVLEKPTNGHPRSAKAGIMIREGLIPGDRYAFGMVMSGRGVYFEGRRGILGGEPGNFAIQGTEDADLKPPVFLRLVKEGAVVSAFESTDGTNFTPVGDPQDFGRILPVTYVGLGVSAVSTNDPALRYVTAKFAISSLKIEYK